eukprot:Skav228056  [mRNA]  locus=scaffold2067:16690:17585:- [translate_table: standard]
MPHPKRQPNRRCLGTGAEELLVDLTDWLKRFSEYFKGDGQQTQILVTWMQYDGIQAPTACAAYPFQVLNVPSRIALRAQEAKGYRENFLVRCSTQQQSKLPVKSAKDSLTVYFTAPRRYQDAPEVSVAPRSSSLAQVAFAALPAEPMIPRASDARCWAEQGALLLIPGSAQLSNGLVVICVLICWSYWRMRVGPRSTWKWQN